jgi:mannose-6-phosphate isomerase-like protein (cupin superfamily)
MASECTKIYLNALLSVLFIHAVACTPYPRFYLQYGDQLTESDLKKVLADNPLPTTENIRVTTLGQSRGVSHHVVQIRDREVPHIHKEHDLTVVVLKGKGYLMLGTKRVELAKGDVLFISRGTAHYFVNTFDQPSVALAAFTPPFDGKDTISAEKQ